MLPILSMPIAATRALVTCQDVLLNYFAGFFFPISPCSLCYPESQHPFTGVPALKNLRSILPWLLCVLTWPLAAQEKLPKPLVTGLKNPESVAVGFNGQVFVNNT